ncbi:4Fe-4S dicluster domain-containing protein [Geomonas sp.]|uniref:4Fe-4S dicluster domain-containing protein n=1 Tax=Geomonas sp. TaxID=2651584 RepID=UPI002B45C925|nr:4Fe-4S dicluster domain-containing protein [Geomonas sp.]HJV35457.1 4Fe-4S dicluster domain-containing protein [Geomonas sp.]
MSKMSRRAFLWFAGGSGFAIASNEPRKLINKLIPQVIPPEYIRPGEWDFFATTCRECPAGCGMHVWHRDGRATKAEGNPQHPVNRGGLCARGQSALQGLYDPDRLQQVIYRPKGGGERTSSWQEAFSAIAARVSAGGNVVVISNLQTGSLAEIMKGFAGAFGSNRVLFYEPFNYEALRSAHQQFFGLPVVPSYHLERSDFILSLSADFLETWISPVEFARDFADLHSYQGGSRMNRMVYVGPRLSMTAANADTFLQVPPGYERVVVASMLKIMMDKGGLKNDISGARAAVEALFSQAGPVPGLSQQALEEVTRTFASARAPLVLAGPVGGKGPVATDTALAASLLNHAVGAVGNTVDFSRPHALSNTALEAEVDAVFNSLGPQDIVFVHDSNPGYTRAAAASQLSRAGMVVYLGTMMDETAHKAQWVLPIDFPLESWGEYQPSAGIAGLMQPTMGRLYDTRSAGDIFLTLAAQAGRPLTSGPGAAPQNFESWLKRRWSGLSSAALGGGGLSSGGTSSAGMAGSGDDPWTVALRNGGVWQSNRGTGAGGARAAAPGSVKFSAPAAATRPATDQAQLWLWSSPMAFDGRYANRGWIQEAPDPTTFIVWGNWIDLHPKKATALGLCDGDLAELRTGAGVLRAPVRVSNDVHEQVAAISFGHGHQTMGANADRIGANAFLLLGAPQQGEMFGSCRIRRVSESFPTLLTRTTISREQYNREVVQWVPLSKLSRMQPGDGDKLVLPLPEGYRKDKDLYPKRGYNKHRWGMVIDLQRCIGCGACAVACYAENNISVVGKEKVGSGREMAWLRVAPYRKENSHRYSWLPLLCQHCDAAPCEPVCPVFAAVHNEEGLNAQIYNRCIGTRYCSNNCPYKVRRFNWINIVWKKPLDLQLNPEVTVRTRGVMEKCTFCVQRIRQAEYRAVRERRKIADGEIQPACAQSCPARVYTFGDLLDPNSQVNMLMLSDPRRYHLLEDLNTKPAVTFLRRVDIDA